MWSIGEVKKRGWNGLKRYYWAAFLVSLISLLLGDSDVGGGIRFNLNIGQGNESAAVADGTSWVISGNGVFRGLAENISLAWIPLILSIGLVMAAAAILFSVFVGGPITVGRCRFFNESREKGESAGIGSVFWVFSSGFYMNVVKIMFLRNLYTFLWSLLLVIPGIYKAYEYAMIPYILSENPDADSRDVFAATKEMMDGNRFHMFLTDLSFIGWYILGTIACGIGVWFVNPYYEATISEVYAGLRGGIYNFPFRGFGGPEKSYDSEYDRPVEDGFDDGYNRGI